MKKGEILALAVIGVAFVGVTLLAFGNPMGIFVVGGALMSGQLLISWYDTAGNHAGGVHAYSDSGNTSSRSISLRRN